MICARWAKAAKDAKKGLFVESQARKVLNEILESSGHGRLRNPTIRQYLVDWLDSKQLSKSPNTFKRYKHTIETFLAHLGDKSSRLLDQISPRDIEKFRDAQKREGKTASTVNTDIKTLRIPFNKARRQGLLLTDPAAAVDLLFAQQQARRPFSIDQVKALLKIADVEWKGMILVSVTAGLRIGDAARLTWDAIDFDKKVVRYFAEKTRGSRQAPVEAIMLSDFEKYLLSLPIRSRKSNAPLFPSLHKLRTGGCNGLSARFRRLMGNAEIFPTLDERKRSGKARQFKDLSFHSLRHTCVSLMANNGVPEELRMKLVGHTSDAHKRYTHHELATLRSALANFPSLE